MKFNYKTVIATTVFIAMTSPMMVNASIKNTEAEHSQVTVVYNSAELNTQAGKAKIEDQLRVAAREVCGVVTLREVRSYSKWVENKSCLIDAVENAMATIEDRALNATDGLAVNAIEVRETTGS
jgi:UrcA family protein